MSVTETDHSSILRVSGDSLESITLRSDLAARSTFLMETLLEGVGVVKTSPLADTTIELGDVIQTGMSDIEYLQQWQKKLEEEVAECEKQDVTGEDIDKTTELLKQMDGPALTSVEDVQKEVQRLEALLK